MEFTCPANQAGATCSISSGHSFSITNAAAANHPAMNAYASTGSNSWGHFETPGLGTLAAGERRAYAGNDLVFKLDSGNKVNKDQIIDIGPILVITGQDANANVSSFASPAYVTVKLKGVAGVTPPSQAPTVNARAVSPTEIEVTWTNPQDYTQEWIGRTKEGVPSGQSPSTDKEKGYYYYGVSTEEKTKKGGPYTQIIPAESNKTYGVFIRAYPLNSQ